MAETDLIIGRKQLMVALHLCNWNAVQRMVSREGCPIGKIGGRWSAQRHLLLAWITSRQGGGEPVNLRESLQKFTDAVTAKSIATRSQKRGKLMQMFLVEYKKVMTISGACRNVGISRRSYHNWRTRFERFDYACSSIESSFKCEVFDVSLNQESQTNNENTGFEELGISIESY